MSSDPTMPRTFKIKTIESEMARKWLKKTNDPEYHNKIQMPRYLCLGCEKNYWTRIVLIQKSMFDQAPSRVCERCYEFLSEMCRIQGFRLKVLQMRRNEENSKEIDKRLGQN